MPERDRRIDTEVSDVIVVANEVSARSSRATSLRALLSQSLGDFSPKAYFIVEVPSAPRRDEGKLVGQLVGW